MSKTVSPKARQSTTKPNTPNYPIPTTYYGIEPSRENKTCGAEVETQNGVMGPIVFLITTSPRGVRRRLMLTSPLVQLIEEAVQSQLLLDARPARRA
jgi:hypothetical protein